MDEDARPDGAEQDEAPPSHAEIRKRWAEAQRNNGETHGAAPMRIVLPSWFGHALLVVLLGGFGVALAAMLTGSILAWYAMFLVIGFWMARGSGAPWWVGAIVALAAVPVANRSLEMLVTHGGFNMLGNALSLAASGAGRHSGWSVYGLPMLLGAIGGFVAHHVQSK